MRLSRMQDDSGGIAIVAAAVMFALALPMMILVIDGGGLFTERRQLQNASDAGAYAAAKWCSNLPLLSTCDEASAYDQAVPFVTGNDAFDKKDNDGVSFDSDPWYLCGTAVSVECTDTDPDPAVEYYSKYDCPPVTPALLSGRPFVQVRVISGNGGWKGVISDTSTAVFSCSRAVLDPPIASTVHHPAITHTIEHPAGTHTVEHPAETHDVEHPAETHILHHPAETHNVDHPGVTHVVTHPAETHDVDHPAESHTVVHPDITHTVDHPAVTHTVNHPEEFHTILHPEISHVVHHPAVYPTSGNVLAVTISKCEWINATGNGTSYPVSGVYIEFNPPDSSCVPSGQIAPGSTGALSEAKPGGAGMQTVAIGNVAAAGTGEPSNWKAIGKILLANPNKIWLIPLYDSSTKSGNNVTYHIIGFAAFEVDGFYLSKAANMQDTWAAKNGAVDNVIETLYGHFIGNVLCENIAATCDGNGGSGFGVYTPAWDQTVVDSPEWVETVVDRPAWVETVVDVPAWTETVVDVPSWVETVIDKPAWVETVVDKPAWDETVVDQEPWTEVVVDRAAWDETVVDKAAWTETVIDSAAWTEVITDTEPWTEVVVDTPAWDETTYTQSGTASMVL